MIMIVMMIPGSGVIGSMSIRGWILGGGGGGDCVGVRWFWIQLMMIHDK